MISVDLFLELRLPHFMASVSINKDFNHKIRELTKLMGYLVGI